MLRDAADEGRANLQQFQSYSDAIDMDEEYESKSLIYYQFPENAGSRSIM